jgi:lactoylglutathione lyase
MFQSRASLGGEIPALQQREIGGALTFYINTEGIKELYADLQNKVSIVQEMHTTFYGAQEFAIQDSNGYILSFSETVS